MHNNHITCVSVYLVKNLSHRLNGWSPTGNSDDVDRLPRSYYKLSNPNTNSIKGCMRQAPFCGKSSMRSSRLKSHPVVLYRVSSFTKSSVHSRRFSACFISQGSLCGDCTSVASDLERRNTNIQQHKVCGGKQDEMKRNETSVCLVKDREGD
jgi:hypothetical protein